MVNLRKKPFYLNDEQIAWVENTIRDMTLEEKFGQLFVLLKATPGVDERPFKTRLRRAIRVACAGRVETRKPSISKI